MNVSAFTFTSGLGQEIDDGPASIGSSSLSGELVTLRILTKSACVTYSTFGILNGSGGGGGGIGISGDGGAISVWLRYGSAAGFVGFGGRQALLWGFRAGGGGTATSLNRRLRLSDLTKEFRIDDGGGGGGGGGVVDDLWKRLLMLPVLNRLLKIEFGGGGGGGGGAGGCEVVVETE